jgi:hypothetical protein
LKSPPSIERSAEEGFTAILDGTSSERLKLLHVYGFIDNPTMHRRSQILYSQAAYLNLNPAIESVSEVISHECKTGSASQWSNH